MNLSKGLSISSTSPLLILLMILSRSSSIQDNPFIVSPIVPSRPLFRFESHPEEESPPRSVMRSSILFMTVLILSRVSGLRGVGSAFHELITGIRPTISEDTEETLDVACSLLRVVVIGGTVIVEEDVGVLMTESVFWLD